ncbi:MAG: thiamine pyrophosphate-dependent enzyme [Gemmatimonadaceae bacterium]
MSGTFGKSSHRMPEQDALALLHAARGERDVVVTTMSTARDWMTLPQSPLDLVFVPSAMSHATSVGLGLALAQPNRRVIVANGDGSMLMNLGSLVSIAAAGAPNMVVVLFDNGVYEVTGAQLTAGSRGVDFGAIAKGAGFTSVFQFDTLSAWRRDIHKTLNAAGPGFVWLSVEPVSGIPGPRSPGPARDRAKRLKDALNADSAPATFNIE